MSVSILALALVAAIPLAGAPAPPVALTSMTVAEAAPPAAPELAAQPLAAGQAEHALASLEKASTANPHDPGLLINLGIAYAHMGDEARARAAFEQAAACHEVIELDTADGGVTDSRRLARKALKMLARGEFRVLAGQAGQLTYRDR